MEMKSKFKMDVRKNFVAEFAYYIFPIEVVKITFLQTNPSPFLFDR